jgi:hypothetical protein
LTLVFFLVTGLRFSFGIAQEERANWIFQVAVCDASPNARGTVRKLILTAVIGLVLASIPVYAVAAGTTFAIWHAAFAMANAVLLTEALLVSFRNIPFTCTYLPARDNLIFGIAVFGAALLVFAQGGARLEEWLLRRPWFLIPYAMFLAGALFALRVVRDTDLPVEYEQRTGTLELLRLSE